MFKSKKIKELEERIIRLEQIVEQLLKEEEKPKYFGGK